MVRGLLLNIGLHHAASTALGLAITWPAQVLFISAFMTVFATVIAIAKDLPDVLRRALDVDGPALIEIDMASIGDFAQAFAGPPAKTSPDDD